MNWFASAKTLHRWTVLVVRLLKEGDYLLVKESKRVEVADVVVVGKVMHVNDVVKVNLVEGHKLFALLILKNDN